jgi:hypothetical protein
MADYPLNSWGMIPGPTEAEQKAQAEYEKYIRAAKAQIIREMAVKDRPSYHMPPRPVTVAVPKEDWVKAQFFVRFLQENQPELYKTLVDGANAHWAMTSDK